VKFYAVDDLLAGAINAGNTRVRVRVSFDEGGLGEFAAIPERDVLELTVTSLKEKTGGTITSGTLVLDNARASYCPRLATSLVPGMAVEIAYTTGADIPFVKRFRLFVDDRGFQQTATGAATRVCVVGLVDVSDSLKKTDRENDWTSEAVFAHSLVCDKEKPASSLVHRIASRAGLTVNDIDCSFVGAYLPFVKLTRSVWAELSELAAVYGAHLECALEKPLVFVSSADEAQFVFDQTNVTHIRQYELFDQYRNTVRLRWTRYREFTDVELWRYADTPIAYTATLAPTFPFSVDGEKRAIEHAGYEAPFTVRTDDGKTLAAVYSENVDTAETFAARLVTNGPALTVRAYDATARRDRATIRLSAEADTVLVSATIRGDAIAGEANFSQYVRDDAEVALRGTVAVNVSSPYLSESETDGVPLYAAYAARLLAKLKRPRKGFFLKTNRGVFHARVGAAVRLKLADGIESERAEIVQMELRYKKTEAFVASFFLEEE